MVNLFQVFIEIVFSPNILKVYLYEAKIILY